MTDALSWDQALDALEDHILSAETMLNGDAQELEVDAWVKPQGLGPMPTHLVDRAMALRARQATLLAVIPVVLAENRKQRQMAARMDTAPGRRRADAVYVDVSA